MAKTAKPPSDMVIEAADGPAPVDATGETAEAVAPRPATLAECNRMAQRHLQAAATEQGAR